MTATSIRQLAEAMQKVLGPVADQLAQETGFIRRHRKLSGSSFVQTLVWSWLAQPQATVEQLAQTAVALGVEISPQGLDQRFTPEAAQLLQRVLEVALQQLIQADPATMPLLQRFQGVYLLDSTQIALPPELAGIWSGCGGSHGPNAALKASVVWDYARGAMAQLQLQPGREHDRSSQGQQLSLPQGALRIADLGYFTLERLAQLDSQGVYWLSRVQAGTTAFDAHGKLWELVELLEAQGRDTVELEIGLGAQQRVPCRLLAQREAPTVVNQRRKELRTQARRRGQPLTQARLKLAQWTILVTNAPAPWLSGTEARVLYRVRWQIELLFKLWKQQGQLCRWRSHKPWRILCEVYGKLLMLLVQHWVLLVSHWRYANRSSFKAVQTLHQLALHLALAWADLRQLQQALSVIQRCLSKGCRIHKRKTRSATFQQLLALSGYP